MTADASTATARLLDAMLPVAAFDGWNTAALAQAAREAGLDAGHVALIAPGGALDMVALWSARCDTAAREAIAAEPGFAAMKVREKAAFAVRARLQAISPHEEAARRARARLLLPDAAGLGAELVWATSDMIWRALGDRSTDVNYYTKRLTLSGVYVAALSAWLADTSADKADANAFLDRRIADVMQFEKLKAQARKTAANLPDPLRVLGGLRHGWGSRG